MLSFVANDMKRSLKSTAPVFLVNIFLAFMNGILFGFFNSFSSLFLGYTPGNTTLRFTYSYSSDTFTFFSFIAILSIILYAITNYVFLSYYVEKRTKDIIIMKTTGIKHDDIRTFFHLPVFILSLVGLCVGVLSGVGTSQVMSAGTIIDDTWSYIFIISVIGVNIFVLLYAPSRALGLLLKKPVAELVSADHARDFMHLRKKNFIARLVGKLSRTSSFAYKNMMTKKQDFTRAWFVTGTTFIVLGILFTSPFIVQASYHAYITGSTGGHDSGGILAFGHQDVVSQIEYSYRSFYESDGQHATLDLMNVNYSFNPSLIETTPSEDVLASIDARVAQFTTARELQGIEIDNETGTPNYIIIGKHRESTILAFGVDFDRVFNRWTAVDGLDLLATGESVLIGDSVAGLLFDNIYKQRIELFDSRFDIHGVVLDPVYNGLSAYMAIAKARESAELAPDFFNCAFLTLNQAEIGDREETVNQLRQELAAIYGAEFTLVDLAPIFSTIKASIDSLSWLYGLLASFFFLFAIIIQVEFVRLFIRSSLDDFRTMFAIGIKKSVINKIILEEFFFVLVPSCTLAFGITLIINSVFLIQEPVLPPLVVPVSTFIALAGSTCTLIWMVNLHRLKLMFQATPS